MSECIHIHTVSLLASYRDYRDFSLEIRIRCFSTYKTNKKSIDLLIL